ncbi:unnamed protein product [Moneuplotes crassus]|uniref:Uncharacterized protein n=1 Tax=Euplotes crassus TaxID=5936 RepID=A0AAD1XNT0_EUPCR|nr:unnamed protein product [Moneuplotes crassus]
MGKQKQIKNLYETDNKQKKKKANERHSKARKQARKEPVSYSISEILKKVRDSGQCDGGDSSIFKRSNNDYTQNHASTPTGFQMSSVRKLNNKRSSDTSDSYCKDQMNPGSMLEDLTTTKSIKNNVGTSHTYSNTKLDFQSPKRKFKKNKKSVRRNLPQIKINLQHCKFESIKKVATKFGWQLTSDSESASISSGNDWDVCWLDGGVSSQFFRQMRLHQICNHFPGMNQITRKNTLALTMKKLQKESGNQDKYDFIPKTWVLPSEGYELNEFVVKMKKKSNFSHLTTEKQGKIKRDPYFIVKPEAGAQGRGIYLTKKLSDISTFKKCVVQEYIHNPFLIDGYKFDLRIYVLVTRAEPLTMFVYKEGIARFCTEKYDLNSINKDDEKNNFIHLTNFSINKKNTDLENESVPSFQEEQVEEGKEFGIKIRDKKVVKKLMSEVFDHLDLEGFDKYELWEEIKDIFKDTIMSIQESLAHNYKSLQPRNKRMDMCFEILGFDILIDDFGQPWLIEVNHAPSFGTGSEIDRKVKEGLISDTFKLLNISSRTKRRKLQMNARELQERVHNNRNPKEYIHVYNNYGEREMYKQMNHELTNMGNFEKIHTILKEKDNSQDSDATDEYIDFQIPDDLSDFHSDVDISIGGASAPRIINAIDDREEDFTKLTEKVRNIIKTPKKSRSKARRRAKKAKINEAIMIKSRDTSTSIFPQIKNPPGKRRKLMLMSNEERRSKLTEKINAKKQSDTVYSPAHTSISERQDNLTSLNLTKAKLRRRLDQGVPRKGKIRNSSRKSLLRIEKDPRFKGIHQSKLAYQDHNTSQAKKEFKYYSSAKPEEDYTTSKKQLFYNSRKERNKLKKALPQIKNAQSMSVGPHTRHIPNPKNAQKYPKRYGLTNPPNHRESSLDPFPNSYYHPPQILPPSHPIPSPQIPLTSRHGSESLNLSQQEIKTLQTLQKKNPKKNTTRLTQNNIFT